MDLYSNNAANALSNSEQNEMWRKHTDDLKASLIIENKENASSLIDIGCAWGQILERLEGHFENLAGVDEAESRLGSIRKRLPDVDIYKCNSSSLDISSNRFDIVLMSHILHEIKLFSSKKDFVSSMNEVRRVLTSNGRFFIIDHVDPGEGDCTIALDNNTLDKFHYFVENFIYRKIIFSQKNNEITMSIRDFHNFLTKIWSLSTGAEKLEMDETHTVIKPEEVNNDLIPYGFKMEKKETFNSIRNLMDLYNISLTRGEYWNRQILMIFSTVKE